MSRTLRQLVGQGKAQCSGRVLKPVLGLLILAGSAAAACSGSGTVWSCPAGATTSDVQTAINSAADGATITFAAGAYSWVPTITVSLTKAVTMICATPPASPATIGSATSNQCAVSVPSFGGVVGLIGHDSITPGTTSNKLYRVSGFTFTVQGSAWALLYFDNLNSPPTTGQTFIRQIRFDHNTITGPGSNMAAVFQCGDEGSNTYCYGVMDHNSVTMAAETALAFPLGYVDPNPAPLSFGGPNNFFVEDNIFTTTNFTQNSVPCFTDAWGAAANLVLRHNQVTNCAAAIHDLSHAGGASNVEVYNNAFILNNGAVNSGITTGVHMFHDQGAGVEIGFNNQFTTLATPVDYNTFAAFGPGYTDSNCGAAGVSYPCAAPAANCLEFGGSVTGICHQPGRDFAGNLIPIYSWNNIATNTGAKLDFVSDGFPAGDTYIQPNRDVYYAVSASANSSPTSPFNGTVGVGFGTMANRPTTCTHSNSTNPTLSPRDDGHGGVGYYVPASSATASSILPGNDQGTLYNCSNTNTGGCTAAGSNFWCPLYTPYTYPHPLVAGSGGGGGTLSITTTTLANPVHGVAYSQTISTSGGTAPITFAITSGALPPGLTLNASTGVISGTTP